MSMTRSLPHRFIFRVVLGMSLWILLGSFVEQNVSNPILPRPGFDFQSIRLVTRPPRTQKLNEISTNEPHNFAMNCQYLTSIRILTSYPDVNGKILPSALLLSGSVSTFILQIFWSVSLLATFCEFHYFLLHLFSAAKLYCAISITPYDPINFFRIDYTHARRRALTRTRT